MSDHATSLTAKLRALAVGDTIYIPDDYSTRPDTPSKVERAVHSTRRVSDMRERRYRTSRMLAVQVTPVYAMPVLLIQRIA